MLYKIFGRLATRHDEAVERSNTQMRLFLARNFEGQIVSRCRL